MPGPAAEGPARDRAGFLRRWSELHEGIDPSGVRFVRGWLTIVYIVARPVARLRVSPTMVTLTGLLVAATVPLVTAAGDRWPLAATVLVLVSGVLDSVDGAVAALSGRATRWGALLDAVCDRLADTAYGVALWVLGAPPALALAWVVLSFVSEYARARAQVLIGGELDAVTLAERPTRVIVTVATLLAGGMVPSSAATAGTIGAAAGTVTAAIGLAQLMLAVRRRLR